MSRKRMNEKFFYDPDSIITDKWKQNPYNPNEWYKYRINRIGLMIARVTKDPKRSDEWDKNKERHIWEFIGDFIHHCRDERQTIDFLGDKERGRIK